MSPIVLCSSADGWSGVIENQQISSYFVLCVGLMVFLGAAIHIVWGHWRLEVLSSWKLRPNHVILQLTMGSWYFGCICGTLLAAVFIKTWTKKQLYVSIRHTNIYNFFAVCVGKTLPNDKTYYSHDDLLHITLRPQNKFRMVELKNFSIDFLVFFRRSVCCSENDGKLS